MFAAGTTTSKQFTGEQGSVKCYSKKVPYVINFDEKAKIKWLKVFDSTGA